jgi:aryl-alcohol dehydrogenase-like predicted oxidoreductase
MWTVGRIALLGWGVTAAVSYALLGDLVARLIEGYDRASISWLPLWVTLALVTASLVLTVLTLTRMRGPGDAEGGTARTGRRRFLLAGVGFLAAAGGVLATLGAAIAKNPRWFSVSVRNIFIVRPPYKANVVRAEWSGSRIGAYRRLGRTGALVSDISIGSGSSTGGRQTVEVVREAIDRGINYFDTAPDYAAAGSETRFGEAIEGRRDEVFLATKFCRPTGHLYPGHRVEDYIEAVNGSLARLRTDRVDLVHIHSCDSLERLLDENTHEAFDRLKEQGKVRFLGVSTHTPNLEPVADAAIASGRFDVMMLAYHFGAWPRLGEIIDRAAANDIGVVAMKTLRGSAHQGLDASTEGRDSFTQASFKWVLSNPSVSCLVISLWESGQLDEFLYASGKAPGAGDLALLERYDALAASGGLCRPHCGACLDRCPEGLPINDVLRQRMYFERFGAEKEAMRLYSNLSTRADVCSGCPAPCAGACPDGVPIAQSTREAHRLLALGG